jgi:hypothetical protein
MPQVVEHLSSKLSVPTLIPTTEQQQNLTKLTFTNRRLTDNYLTGHLPGRQF